MRQTKTFIDDSPPNTVAGLHQGGEREVRASSLSRPTRWLFVRACCLRTGSSLVPVIDPACGCPRALDRRHDVQFCKTCNAHKMVPSVSVDQACSLAPCASPSSAVDILPHGTNLSQTFHSLQHIRSLELMCKTAVNMSGTYHFRRSHD